jgi:putative tryptophan/tyrosine transport system substrate-binding protein
MKPESRYCGAGIPCGVGANDTRRLTRRALLLAAAAWPALAWADAVRAQVSATVRRIGLLSPFPPSSAELWHRAFRQGLRDLGWIEGKNISIEYRYAEGRSDRLPELAADLVRLNVDIIVTSVSPDALAAKNATGTIPIVMAASGDPVALGLVENLARPGGNITGLSQISPELAGKRLELLKEIVPKLSRVAVLRNPQSKISEIDWKESQPPAHALGLRLRSVEARSLTDFDKAFADAARERAGAVAVTPDELFSGNLKQIADLATKNRLPAVYHTREFADFGGLMTYGPDRSDMFRRAATYVDRILKGAKPSDLPIELPTKFELVVNMRTAKALGITVPQSLLFRADSLIE